MSIEKDKTIKPSLNEPGKTNESEKKSLNEPAPSSVNEERKNRNKLNE